MFLIRIYSTLHIPDADIIEAVIYAMANMFLNDADLNAVKEEIKMSPLGTMI